MTLEETLSEFAGILEINRDVNWRTGDIAANAIKNHGRNVIGKLAETARCSKERIAQLVRIAVTFPHETRYPDIDWSIYRAVYCAAKRTGEDAIEVLEHVYDNGLSLADIAALGTEAKETAKLARRCEWCDSKITIEAKGLAGTRINCPVCLAANEQEMVLGVLEAE